jgi:hypothetical protein
MRSGRPLLLAILASLVLHTMALVLVRIPEGQAITDAAPIEVALLPPQAPSANAPLVRPAPAQPAPQQMVAPPDVINDRAPDHARFESDRDNTVLQETVNPGVPHPAAPVAPPPPQAPARKAESARERPRADAQDDSDEDTAAKSKASRRSAPALEDLFAPTDELVRAQREDDRAAETERAGKAAAENPAAAGRRRLALAVPPVAPEWSLPGRRGTFDYLPDIQRGDVTLLNTKANVFAPFVRRVGERVFQHLVIRQRSLQLQQILTAHDAVEMRVVLDARGKLKSVHVETHSGSASMDDTLSEALNTAAFDNNPPSAAANAAGEYEFVFAAQLRTFDPGQGNLPSRIESRLSVGLL